MDKALRRSIDRNIWRLVWPNVISNITVPLLGLADVAIAGRAGGDATIGAVAIGTTVFNFIYWNCGFLRMGTSGVTAQAYGAADKAECARTLTRGCAIALALGIMLLMLRTPIIRVSELLIESPTSVAGQAHTYLLTRFFAVPAAIMIFAIHGWFIGMQDSRSPMLISLAGNVVNIGVSIWLAIGRGMGVEGIAWGTVAAQYAQLALSALVWRLKYSPSMPLASLGESLNASSLRRFFGINSDIFLRTLCIVVTYTVFSTLSARMGETQLAVNSLLMQLLMVFSYLSDGVAFAAESLSGRYVGARDTAMLRNTIVRLMVWAMTACAAYTIVYGIWWREILSVFGPSASVLHVAADYVGWVAALPLVAFFPFLVDGLMFGATRTRPLRNTTAIAMVTYLAMLPLTHWFGSHALWAAFLMFFSARGALLIKHARRLMRGE